MAALLDLMGKIRVISWGDKSERTYFVRSQGRDIACSFLFQLVCFELSGSWELVDILERSLEHTACFVLNGWE